MDERHTKNNLGYVSIVLSDESIKMKTCILKNANSENLNNLILHNLSMLEKILNYNKKINVHLFRISSEILPFASHKIFKLDWEELYKEQLKNIGKIAIQNQIRLSMHVGQYTLLTTKDEDLLARSIKDLEYHTKFLNALNLSKDCKVIIHVGGVYGNKIDAMNRFINNYKKLSKVIKDRLVIENDDKSYTVDDCLLISKKTKIPVVFDYLHYNLNHYPDEDNYIMQIEKCAKTWRRKDGLPKIHYSQQAENKPRGSHSESIKKEEFLKFYNSVPIIADIMLEVKDKDLSALNCLKWINE